MDIPQTKLREVLQNELEDGMVLPYDNLATRGSLANPIGYRKGQKNYLMRYEILEGRGYSMLDNNWNPLSPYFVIVAVPTKELWKKLVHDDN